MPDEDPEIFEEEQAISRRPIPLEFREAAHAIIRWYVTVAIHSNRRARALIKPRDKMLSPGMYPQWKAFSQKKVQLLCKFDMLVWSAASSCLSARGLGLRYVGLVDQWPVAAICRGIHQQLEEDFANLVYFSGPIFHRSLDWFVHYFADRDQPFERWDKIEYAELDIKTSDFVGILTDEVSENDQFTRWLKTDEFGPPWLIEAGLERGKRCVDGHWE